MSNLIFFDTETTGNTENDFLVQFAYKNSDDSFVALYKPPVKIPPEVSAIHHISNKMVENRPSFASSADLPKIKQIFEHENSIVVAHNAPFDLMMINKEGINPNKFICTLRVARHLDPEGKIDRYNLQYLRYLLDLDVDATAHDALGDVLVLEKLFERLLKKIMEENGVDEAEAVEKMIEISSRPSLMRTFSFGKYNGRKIEEILHADRGYLEWLLSQKEKSGQKEEDWLYTLRHHLEK